MWVTLEPQKALQAGVPGEGGFLRCELGSPWMHHLPSPAVWLSCSHPLGWPQLTLCHWTAAHLCWAERFGWHSGGVP